MNPELDAGETATAAAAAAAAAAAKIDAQLNALQFEQLNEDLTADQREVIKMLEDMDRAHLQKDGPPSIHSIRSASNADSNAAIKALAALGDDDRITPPPPLALDQDQSGLPPTPPTMTNSEVAEAKSHRLVSPEPHVFADRVRNALNQSHRSGLSTPVIEAHSPPTPDRSPPSKRDTLTVSRPQLVHAYSSFAESFKTAKEALSSRESMSQLHSPMDEPLSNLQLLSVPQRPELMSLDSDTGTATQTDGSDYAMVRVKNYQTESDSDVDRAASQRTGDSDGPMLSPTIQQALAHPSGYGFQHRLRAPIKPGDDFVRMDNALLYGSSKWTSRVAAPADISHPRVGSNPIPHREMDTEVLRNALPAHAESPNLIENLPSASRFELPRESPPLTPASAMQTISPPPENVTEPVSPPTTSTGQAILEGNNATYQFIQRENAKRYSAISDNSGVQVIVVATPESRRTLRHAPKRESLRADLSMASDSKRSSLDGSGHKLRHKRAMPSLGGDSDEAGSPKVEHDASYRRAVKPAPFATFSLPFERHHRGQISVEGRRAISGDTGADYLNGNAALSEPRDSLSAPHRSHTLRRSLRDRGLDRVEFSGERTIGPRSWSVDMTGKFVIRLGSMSSEGIPSPKLRRTSAEKRLCNMDQVRRTSLGRVDELGTASDLVINLPERKAGEEPGSSPWPADRSHPSLGPTKTSIEKKLEDQNELRQDSGDAHNASIDNAYDHQEDSIYGYRKSSDRTIPMSPRRKSFDMRHLHPVETPLSVSQFSGTEGELCEARGVELFPHHNESLLLINGNGRHADEIIEEVTAPDVQTPTFQAFLQRPESQSDSEPPVHSADSPLTNPWAAPEPPKLVFIPPTPVHELDRQVGAPDTSILKSDPQQHLQRPTSLSERVRRYSASLVQPIPFGRSNSFRRQPPQRPQTSPAERPTHLNPFWQPQNFWEEYSSSDGEELGFPDDRLPPGGDTSDVKEKRNSLFPRSMSVRLQGFRGRGGFLQGNSLGIDRHGTNNRRHYIAKRTSEEMLQRMVERRRRRSFTLPFTGGTRVEYVGLAALSARVKDVRMRRQERAAEKRREALREQISPPV